MEGHDNILYIMMIEQKIESHTTLYYIILKKVFLLVKLEIDI